MSKFKDTFPPKKTDFLTKYGAGLLVDHIVQFWQLRGFHGIKAERYLIGGTADTYGVRSNIGADGFPPHTKRGRPQTTGAGVKWRAATEAKA